MKNQAGSRGRIKSECVSFEGPVNMAPVGAAEVPGMFGRLKQLDSHIVELDSLIDSLSQRLHGVLSPEANEPGRIQEQMQQCSEAVQHIVGLTAHVGALQDRIRGLLGRLEL